MYTFAMIKPDAVKTGKSGDIIRLIEQSGFVITRMEKRVLDRTTVESFYAVHKTRSFFSEMISFMLSGPVIVMALAKDDAIPVWRALMGATNPAEAAYGTVRKLYGINIGSNAVHGSDALETAAIELKLFFPDLPIT
jgi:nucleoside-diphosphate kinase